MRIRNRWFICNISYLKLRIRNRWFICNISYLKLGSHTVRNFATRLRELNNHLPYFPHEKGKPEPCKLSDDELVFILNQAKPEEWQAVILGANIELYKIDFQGTADYFEKLEVMKALETKRRKLERSNNTDSNKGIKNYSKDKSGTSKTQSKDTKCAHCGRMNHASKDCWFSPENKGKSKPGKKSSDKTVIMTTEQLNTILEQLTPRNSKSGTRKVRFSPVQEDTENVTMYESKSKHRKVDINEFSVEDSIYFGLHTNCYNVSTMMKIVLNDKSCLIRPSKSWEKFMVLMRMVSYVYC